MKPFRRFLIERAERHPETGKFQTKDKHMVMTFGRMNPPHIGHLAVVNKVRQVADRVKGDHAVIMSHSQDNKKNPLSSHRKMQYARTIFPRGTNLRVSSKASPSIISHAKQFNQQGYNHLHVVVGSDRVKEFKNKLSKYNGREYAFRSITVHSAGSRAGKSAIPYSASKMRAAAQAGDYDTFAGGLPKQYPKKLTQHMMKDVSRGLK